MVEENMEIYFLPFDIGNRVKLIISPYTPGEIINFDQEEKLVIIKSESGEIIEHQKIQ